MQQIDIHTHLIRKEGSIQILNIFAQDLPVIQADYLFSAGLHPWHIGTVNAEECLLKIKRATQRPNMLAIGECGLDRSLPTDFALQESYFKAQIEIAITTAKPLIIHCVRAYSDLLKLKKETCTEIPWVIHGFRGKPELTKNLIKHGFYFSVGEQFLNDESRQGVIRSIPLEQLFLETDDREISISNLYLKAAQVLKIDKEILAEIILRNFETVFSNARKIK